MLFMSLTERTEKVSLGSIKTVVSEPIEGHTEYHLMVSCSCVSSLVDLVTTCVTCALMVTMLNLLSIGRRHLEFTSGGYFDT